MHAVLSRGRFAVATAVMAAMPVCARAQPPQPVQPITRLSMDDAIRLALARNQTLLAQRLTVDESKADEVTAALKPNFNVNFGVGGFQAFTPSTVYASDFWSNEAVTSAGVTYLFERGGKRENRIQVAQATTDVTSKTVFDAERQLRFQTAQAF